MARPSKIYWDSCAWLGFLNGEPDKKRELEIVYDQARKGYYELWTSTLSMVEVRRLDSEKYAPKPLNDENAMTIQRLFRQPFVKAIPLGVEIADSARDLFRLTPGLRKFQDAIHLASALRWESQIMHTYDNDDLLHLNLKFRCKNGEKLNICYPDETTDGPLFSQNNNKRPG
ncbi:type II toxin-antitoxin system VapC family toxin [Prosthecodimorpha hirschii]|uniref:type II toxin-antitoxin system VapC family toxin n=1 Tax=Prosthecodimorpha hirschii TaxID=665126 RepID=UPI0015E38C69